MFGIKDPIVAMAFLLCIGSTLLCFVWGFFNWNKGDEAIGDAQEAKDWSEEEERVNEEL